MRGDKTKIGGGAMRRHDKIRKREKEKDRREDRKMRGYPRVYENRTEIVTRGKDPRKTEKEGIIRGNFYATLYVICTGGYHNKTGVDGFCDLNWLSSEANDEEEDTFQRNMKVLFISL
ncbi:hypothetical protein ACFX13_045115 [Malus domestica]